MDRRLFIRRILAGGATLGAASTFGVPLLQAAGTAPATGPADPARWKLALATHSYHELNQRRVLERVVEHEISRIELNDNHVSLLASEPDLTITRQRLKRHGLTAVGSYTGRYSDDPAQNRRLFETARALGLEYLDGYPPPALLPELLDLADEFGVRFAILNTADDEPYGDDERVAAQLDRHDRLGTVVDVGHYARAGVDPAAVLERFAGRIVAIHAKDLTTTEGPESDDPYTVVGTGVLDWPDLAQVLARTRCDGHVVLSYTGDFGNYFKRGPKIEASLDNLRALSAGEALLHDTVPTSPTSDQEVS